MKKTKDTGKVAAIIPSAGSGKRMGLRTNKNYLTIADRPVLARTIAAFDGCASISSIIVVVPRGDETYCKDRILKPHRFKKPIRVVPGGPERQDSVANGLGSVDKDSSIIVIHDGARPLVTAELIEAVISGAFSAGAAICAVPVKDTIKLARGSFVEMTVARERLWSVQTPQAFKAELLREAFKMAKDTGMRATDESGLVEALGKTVKIVPGSYENIKITTPEDLRIAGCLLKSSTR